MGFSPLVVLYTSVSRVITFLMWMVVLLSSSTSLSRFEFGYILYGELFLDLIYFVLQCFTVEHPDKATIIELRQDKGII